MTVPAASALTATIPASFDSDPTPDKLKDASPQEILQHLAKLKNLDAAAPKLLLAALGNRDKGDLQKAEDALVKDPAGFLDLKNGQFDAGRVNDLANRLSALSGTKLPEGWTADAKAKPAPASSAPISDPAQQKDIDRTQQAAAKAKADATRPELTDDQKKQLRETRHLLSSTKGAGAASEEEIKDLQAKLGMPAEKQTGKYDAETVAAVRKFQTDNKLRVDGDTGQETWSKLLFKDAKPPKWGADMLSQTPAAAKTETPPPAQPEAPPAKPGGPPTPQQLSPDETKLNKFFNDPAAAQAGMKVLTDTTDATRAGKLAQELGEGRLPDDVKDDEIGSVVDNLRKVDGDQKAVASKMADGLQALVSDRRATGQLGGFLGNNVDAREAYKALQSAAGPAASKLGEAISRSGDKDYRLPAELDTKTVQGAIDKLKADSNPGTKEASGKMAASLEGLLGRRSADAEAATTKVLEDALPGKGAALLATLKDRASGQLPRGVSQKDLAGLEAKLAAAADKDPVAKEALGQVRELRGYAIKHAVLNKVTGGDELASLFKGEIPKGATPERLLQLANNLAKLDAKTVASDTSISFDDAQKAIAGAAMQLTNAAAAEIAKTGGDVSPAMQKAMGDLETNLDKVKGNLNLSANDAAKGIDAAHAALRNARTQALALLGLQKIAPPDEAKALLKAINEGSVATSIKPDRLKELQTLVDKVDVQALSREASLSYRDASGLLASIRQALTVQPPPNTSVSV
jgi:peptidoglycan hydrolase-like protein with peptidoglycan-binding domain